MLAQEEARLLGHSFIGTEHLLLGLIHEGEGVAARALESLGVTLEAVRQKVAETLGGPGSAEPSGSPPFTPRAKKVLELALRESLQLGHDFVGTEHLLLGLVREGEGVAVQVLAMLGADPLRVRWAVIGLLAVSDAEPGAGGAHHRPVLSAPGGGIPAGVHPGGRPGVHPGAEHTQVVATGRRWVAEVVVRGRRPEDFATAYDELGALAARLGLADLEASRVHLSSVETDEGPGLRLSVAHDLPAVDAGEQEPGSAE